MTQNHKPITPREAFEETKWIYKATESINAEIEQRGPRDQYSFDYTWIGKKCGISGYNLPEQFLKKLVEIFTQAGWHAWLYEHGKDISGVSEDPAFVLDAPRTRK